MINLNGVHISWYVLLQVMRWHQQRWPSSSFLLFGRKQNLCLVADHLGLEYEWSIYFDDKKNKKKEDEEKSIKSDITFDYIIIHERVTGVFNRLPGLQVWHDAKHK